VLLWSQKGEFQALLFCNGPVIVSPLEQNKMDWRELALGIYVLKIVLLEVDLGH
jgi:hypothetical protein